MAISRWRSESDKGWTVGELIDFLQDFDRDTPVYKGQELQFGHTRLFLIEKYDEGEVLKKSMDEEIVLGPLVLLD